MLRWCGISAVAVLIVAIILVARFGQENDTGGKGYDIKCVQPNDPSTTSATFSCTVNPSQNTKQGKDQPVWWHVLITWPEGITAWLLLLTLGAIVWQSYATAKSADAALLNARAVINAERPWVIVRVRDGVGPTGGFNLYVGNKGRSPALVTGVYLGCDISENISDLPRSPEYKIGNLHKDALVLPGEKQMFFWFDSRIFERLVHTKMPDILSGSKRFVFVKVLYRDLANPDKTLIHETRWIGVYDPPVGEAGNTIKHFEGVGFTEDYQCYK